ncbi:MAG: tRNA (adenosine(37)-N6)-threonylcarbamoyltransferase complex ATPase subunit type 1 TsaE [Paludibacteraceae bacterium]|jgi:tRNA threonylcarbamoyladenosine biosynthesis protein TsaE|nr:tRNA (adenosine(37)-N6)-threonylcarbamoyltransferase complex ATPase subunit type 1 TsaE [Paludibacteraceae bacterium]
MVIRDLTSINETAKEFIAQMGDNRLFFFYGDMGAGKTTFIRAICKELGVTESVNSPTFAIVNEYTDREGKPIYHFDFYRIEKEEEAFDFGYEDYFFSGNLCFVEWPEKIENLIPNEGISVYIQEEENGERSVTLKEKV